MTDGQSIIKGLEDALDYAQGNSLGSKTRKYRVSAPDVRAIRQGLGLSQREFCLRFGVELGTLRHWEQGCRTPDGAARVLLAVISHNPEAVDEALAAAI